MAYSDFSLARVKKAFKLVVDESQSLFDGIAGVQPSDFLSLTLKEYLSLATAINTEKARSELIIAPVLTEVRRQLKNQISLFFGTEFNVDQDRGLQGYCDYILSKSPEQFYISAPTFAIIEAKNESIKGGLGQCIAAIIGAQFNQIAENEIEIIYGAVTSGTN